MGELRTEQLLDSSDEAPQIPRYGRLAARGREHGEVGGGFGRWHVRDLSALDAKGRVVAVVSAENNRGVVAVNGTTTVGKLTVESGGGGLLELADPAGNRQVVLGVTAGSEGRACVTDPAKGTICLGKTAPGVAGR